MEGRSLPAKSFQDLRVWQAANRLSLGIYTLCASFPKHEQYGLSNQMQRAAVSVCANIAEGFGRRSTKEKDQFYSIANGSLMELENQLLIATGIGYLSQEQSNTLYESCAKTHRMLVTLQQVNKKKGAEVRNTDSKIHNLPSII